MGVGAGYKLTLKDVCLDFDRDKIKVEDHGDRVDVTVPVKSGRSDFRAEHPYWSGDGTALIEGGSVTFDVEKREFSDDSYDPKNFNLDEALGWLEDEVGGIDCNGIFSRGYCWCTPNGDWAFKDCDGGSAVVSSANIKSREMARKVQFLHNANDMGEDFDEIDWDHFRENLMDEWSLNEKGSLDDFVWKSGIFKQGRSGELPVRCNVDMFFSRKGTYYVFDKKDDSGRQLAVLSNNQEPFYHLHKLDRGSDGPDFLAALWCRKMRENHYDLECEAEYGFRENFPGGMEKAFKEAVLYEDGTSLANYYDGSFVENILRENPVVSEEIDLFKAALKGKLSIFDSFRENSFAMGPGISCIPPLCIKDDGKTFAGLAQLVATMHCSQLDSGKDVYVLSKRVQGDADGSHVPVMFLGYDAAGKPRMGVGDFTLHEEDNPNAVALCRFRDIMKVEANYRRKYPGKDFPSAKVSVTAENCTLKEYIAGYLAAAELGVSFETTRAVADRCKKEFCDALEAGIVDGEHSRFFSLFDKDMDRTRHIMKMQTHGDVKRVLMAERTVPEMREVSVEDMGVGIGL